MIKALKLYSMKLSAAVIGGFTVGLTSTGAKAQAGGGLDDVITTSSESLINVPQLITAVTYIGGAVLAIGGVLQLKKHVDNPAQEDMRKGVVRVVAGGLLLAAPTFFEIIIQSLDLGDGGGFQNQRFDQINL